MAHTPNTSKPLKPPAQPGKETPSPGTGYTEGFPIVGIGASAGGLQEYTRLLEAMPGESGMAFVLIQHLDPDHKSLMAGLLESHTTMSVSQASDGQRIKPNHVYVIPPNATLQTVNGRIKLTEPITGHGLRLPINAFFQSLAEDRKHRAVGVLLSGTGIDGTRGLQAIREAGGLAIAQEPTDALHAGMPRNAISNGVVDKVLTITEMPQALLVYARHPYVNAMVEPAILSDRARDILDRVLELLKRFCTVDFKLYRQGTLLRRIERRMSIRQVSDGAAYLSLLRDDNDEITQLAKDLLINVSGFFRDQSVFEYLAETVIPDLVRSQPADRPIRVWVAGCATGEEVYSIAMLLIEQTEKQKRHLKIQMFATDIDDSALAVARAGVYPDAIASDVSAERLMRFFNKDEHSYQVKAELRETIVFAEHNLLANAPFSKLDLITCRNVLIYLEPQVQTRVIQLFHFALNDTGVLVLGTSENTGMGEDVFAAIHRKYRVYRRKGARAAAHALDMPIYPLLAHASGRAAGIAVRHPSGFDAGDITRQLLLERHVPAAVLINRQADGLYFYGPVDRYLSIPAGEAGQNLIAMVREGFRADLRAVLQSLKDTGEPTCIESVGSGTDDVRRSVVISAEPVDRGDRNVRSELCLVTFAEKKVEKDADRGHAATALEASEVARLETELASTRRELQFTIADLEASNEELKSANEEAMWMNEEFHSTNEELETSREELQSLNEELTTLNSQLEQKVEEHRQAVDDLNNLLNSTQLVTVFLDKQLRIQRFTPTAKTLFSLILSDAGRPLADITLKFNDETLLGDAQHVIDTLASTEAVVRARNGRWYQRRILPYRTLGDAVEGVVITLNDVSEQKTSEDRANAERRYAEAIVNTVREPLIVLDASLNVVSAGQSFYDTFRIRPELIEGRSILEVDEGRWDIPTLRRGLQSILADGTVLENCELVHDYHETDARSLLLHGRRIDGEDTRPDLILLAIEDVTEARLAASTLDQQNAQLASILQSAQLGIITIGNDGIIQAFSAAAQAIFGYGAGEVIGQNVKILMSDDDRVHHDAYIDHYLRTGEKRIIGNPREVVGLRKNGRRVPLELSVSEARFNHSQLFTGIVRDLSVEKRRQKELIQARKMEAMGQLTGGVAHDFNNLLTVVLGNLELLESGKFCDQRDALFKEARDTISMGGELTRGLLAFGRRLPLHPEKVDLNEVVKQMSVLLKRTLPETIQIDIELGDALWPVDLDSVQFQNALLNICLNARDAMPDGGRLIIETANITLDEDYVSIHGDVSPGDYVAVSATDLGVGMSATVQMRAFEPFFTTKDVGQGSGLGLSMIYGFAKQSGGDVTIYSDEGHGTTITMFFPRGAAKDSALVKEPTVKPTSHAKGETILVVEDDRPVRRVTVRRLEALGYTVLYASSGPLALEIIDSGVDIDLVFTDMVMPGGMGGADVVRQARHKRPGVKVLLTSGYAEQALALDKGEQILRKPYAAITLAERLRDVLDASD